MKKILISIITILTIVSLASCKKDSTTSKNNTNPNKLSSSKTIEKTGLGFDTIIENDKVYVWGAPNTVSIMQDVNVLIQCEYWGTEWLDNSNKIGMEAIKGETESHQIMITAKSKINSFKAKTSDLINEDGTSTISKDNVSLFAERYIEVTASSSTPKKACQFTGFYPDALVPIDLYRVKKENFIDKDMNQGIWVNIDVPSDAKEGTYTGNVFLILDEDTLSVPITLKVYNLTLPEEIHRKTAFDIWNNQIGYGETLTEYEDGEQIDWSKIYYDYLLSKRITPQSITQTSTGEAYANAIVEYAQNPRVTVYRLPYKGTSVDGIESSVVSYSTLVETLTALANKNIELREDGDLTTDLFKKAFFYFASIIDEPSAQKYNAVRYCDDAVSRAKEVVFPLLSEYPDLQESLIRIPHVVTTSINPQLYNAGNGGVQTWCIQAQSYSKDIILGMDDRKNSKDYYTHGENFWVYTTCDSNNPYPSFQLDDNLMSQRIVSWMMYDYDIECSLFWNTCYYSKYFNSDTIKRDVWTDPRSWNKANGDGYLLYPGSRYGLEHPLSTLRLESYREGTEDYEYLYMFERAIEALNSTKGTSFNTDEILSSFYDRIYQDNSMIPGTNVDEFRKVRSECLTLLEILVNDPDSAIALLNK